MYYAPIKKYQPLSIKRIIICWCTTFDVNTEFMKKIRILDFTLYNKTHAH